MIEKKRPYYDAGDMMLGSLAEYVKRYLPPGALFNRVQGADVLGEVTFFKAVDFDGVTTFNAPVSINADVSVIGDVSIDGTLTTKKEVVIESEIRKGDSWFGDEATDKFYMVGRLLPADSGTDIHKITGRLTVADSQVFRLIDGATPPNEKFVIQAGTPWTLDFIGDVTISGAITYTDVLSCDIDHTGLVVDKEVICVGDVSLDRLVKAVVTTGGQVIIGVSSGIPGTTHRGAVLMQDATDSGLYIFDHSITPILFVGVSNKSIGMRADDGSVIFEATRVAHDGWGVGDLYASGDLTVDGSVTCVGLDAGTGLIQTTGNLKIDTTLFVVDAANDAVGIGKVPDVSAGLLLDVSGIEVAGGGVRFGGALPAGAAAIVPTYYAIFTSTPTTNGTTLVSSLVCDNDPAPQIDLAHIACIENNVVGAMTVGSVSASTGTEKALAAYFAMSHPAANDFSFGYVIAGNIDVGVDFSGAGLVPAVCVTGIDFTGATIAGNAIEMAGFGINATNWNITGAGVATFGSSIVIDGVNNEIDLPDDGVIYLDTAKTARIRYLSGVAYFDTSGTDDLEVEAGGVMTVKGTRVTLSAGGGNPIDLEPGTDVIIWGTGKNLIWDSDSGGNIGTVDDNRPEHIYLGRDVNIANSTMVLTATALTASGVLNISAAATSRFSTSAGDIELAPTGQITVVDKNVLWTNDGGGNIGDVGATGRPDSIYLKKQVNVNATILDVNSLDFTGVGAITTGGATDLTLTPAGNLVVSAGAFQVTAGGNVTSTGVLKMGSGAVQLTNAAGKIQAISATYFASLDGSVLTALNAAQLTTGDIPVARLTSHRAEANPHNVYDLSITVDSKIDTDVSTHNTNVTDTHGRVAGVLPLAQIPTMDDVHIPDVETLSYSVGFADAQYPNALLVDGTRDLSGAMKGYTKGSLHYQPDEIGLPLTDPATQGETWTDVETLEFKRNEVDRCTIDLATPDDCDTSQGIDVEIHWGAKDAGDTVKTYKWDIKHGYSDLSGALPPTWTTVAGTPTVVPTTKDILNITTLSAGAPSTAKNLHFVIQRDGVSDTFAKSIYLICVKLIYKRKL